MTLRRTLAAVAALVGLVGAACDKPTSVELCGGVTAASDGAADSLFRHDPTFLGGDGAYSVPLGNGRVLWMFGDSFVAKNGSKSRRDAFFVRNTVAVQTGLDPAGASLQFFWRGNANAPSSFVPEASPLWYWPMGGALVQGRLMLFYVAEKPSTGGLGFEAAGNRVMTVDDPSGPPNGWVLVDRPFPMPKTFGLTLLAPFVDVDVMYVYAIRDPGDHSVSVAKVRTVDAALGDFTKTLWWCADRGWRDATDVGAGPAVVFPSGAATDNPSELSVARRPDGTYVAIHTIGFGAAKLAIRTANKPEGPWSEPCPFFTPPESNAPKAFVYAGKGHAELDGADLTATYVANSFDDQKLLDDPSLYFPRFVRASLTARDAGVDAGDR